MPNKQHKKKFILESKFKPAGDQVLAIASLTKNLHNNIKHQVLLGVTGSGKTYTMANVIANFNRPTLIMAPNKTLAAQLYGEMKSFFPHNAVEYFVSYYDYYQPEAYVPSSDLYIEKDAAINQHIERMRLSATKALLERKDCVIVATVSAIYGLGDPNLYLSMLVHISRGEIIEQRKLLKNLTDIQYNRNDMDRAPGTFRVRGDIIDIFPAETDEYGVKIECFGNEITNIFLFSPLTGEITHEVPRFTIYPKTHYVTPRVRLLEAVEAIKCELVIRREEFLQQNKLLEAQRIEERTKFDLEMILELGYCSGIENYSRYLSGRGAGVPPPTLMDYLAKDALLIIDESHVSIPQIGGMYRGDRARKENLVNYGFRLLSALDNRPLKFEEFCALQPQTVYISATPSEYEMTIAEGNIIEQVVRPTGLVDPEVEVRPATNQVADLLIEIHNTLKNNYRVLVTTLTKRMAEDLTNFLLTHKIKVKYLHSDIDTVERMEILRELRLGNVDVVVGINLLREGLDLPEVALVAILDADKEGFLRSTRSLIQTIGRAARNVHGKVIMYGDKMTNSMQNAITETNRRRDKQINYNKKHKITPQSVVKEIQDIMETSKPVAKKRKTSAFVYNKEELHDLIASKEVQMHELAINLEFEKAALLRDEIELLKKEHSKK